MLALADAAAADILPGLGRESEAEIDLERLQSRLAEGHVVVAFSLADDPSRGSPGAGRAWVITREGIDAHPLPPRRELAARVAALDTSLRADDPAWPEAADALRVMLFATSTAGAKRVTVVPDGELFELPFAVLLPEAAVDQVASLRELGQRSAQDLRELGALSLTVFADPSREGVAFTAAELGDLPHARAQAAAIVRTFGERSEVVVGEEATETRLEAALSQSGLLHVAAHAVVDAAVPRRSALVMARSGSDDGVLTVAELAKVTVRRDIVVLSASRSLAGPRSPGLGLHGLGQTLIRRGARTVIGTRWPIRDDLAQALFENLYAELARGQPVSEALRRTQRAAHDQGTPARAWASLLVLGDGDLRVRRQRPPRAPRPLLGGAIALGGLLLAGGIVAVSRQR